MTNSKAQKFKGQENANIRSVHYKEKFGLIVEVIEYDLYETDRVYRSYGFYFQRLTLYGARATVFFFTGELTTLVLHGPDKSEKVEDLPFIRAVRLAVGYTLMMG